MSVKVSTWAWHDDATKELKSGEMLVLVALADIANDDGDVVFVREKEGEQAALARKCRMSVASFRRLTHELEEKGLLSISRANATAPNQYRLNLTAQSERSDLSGRTAQDERSHRSNAAGHSSIDVLNVTTRMKTSDADASDYSEDVIRLCRLLAMLVSQNGHKVGSVGKLWWSACDRLLRLDGYSVEQVEIIIRWSTSDEFWSANIRSMSKLREKFSTLRAHRNAALAKKPKRSTVAHGQQVDDILRARERAEQLAVTG